MNYRHQAEYFHSTGGAMVSTGYLENISNAHSPARKLDRKGYDNVTFNESQYPTIGF